MLRNRVSRTDSLLSKLPLAKRTEKAHLLNAIAESYLPGDPHKSLNYAVANDMAIKMKDSFKLDLLERIMAQLLQPCINTMKL